MLNLIVPTYKARETLPALLDSLVSQTKKNFFTTLVQDCDGEDYGDIIDTYRARGLNLKLLQLQENVGPGMACQAGIDASEQFEYLMFADADDMLMPRAVEVLHHEAKIRDADLISSNFMRENADGSSEVMIASQTPCTWRHGKIYKRKFLVDNNIRYIPEIRVNEDAFFNLVVANCAEKKFFLNEVTYLWRHNKNSLTRARKPEEWVRDSWSKYVNSQAKGLQKIEELKGEINPELAGLTFINIYNETMLAYYYKADLEEAKPYYKEITQLKEFEKFTYNPNFWKAVGANVKGAIFHYDSLIFYNKNFMEWFNEDLKGANR